MLKLGCCLSPSLLKFLATHLVATASIYQKILRFVFDLIYVWYCGFVAAVHFVSEQLIRFELIITIFELIYVYLSPTFRINVFS